QCVKIDGANWYYFPFLYNFNTASPIVKNLDAVAARFVSSIDTTKAKGIRKTPLLFSSKVSRKINAPVLINRQVGSLVKEAQFKEGKFVVSYLLEGQYVSNFQYRPSPIKGQSVIEKNKNCRIVFVADGDMISDIIDEKTNKQYPLGFDAYGRKQYANAEFIKTVLEYLTEGNAIISAKSGERIVRPLSLFKVQDERLYWQVINLVIPVVLIVLFGVGKYLIRKRKYAHKKA
ncbi:MAG: hypothetical protein AB8B61_08545, partial [Cyclobacteriaceae bacterium]